MAWTSSDTFSTIAIGISLVAAGTSIYQARIARRKEKADAEASDPAFEPDFVMLSEDWPQDWLRLCLNVTNRSDTAITVQRVEIVSPSGVGLRRVGLMNAFNAPPDHPTGKGTKSIDLDEEVRPTGSVFPSSMGSPIPANTSHASLDIYVPRECSGQRLKLKATVGRPNKIAKDRTYQVAVDLRDDAWKRRLPPNPRRN